MAWAEKLPSGRYRGKYRDADGKKRTVPGGPFAHKSRAEREAAAFEGKARRNSWGDIDAPKRPWGHWCDEWWPTRTVEPGTLKRDASRRRVHLDPRWRDVPVGSIRRHDVREWAAAMRRRGVGASTVQRAVHLLSASLAAAVDSEVITANPAARLKLPKGAQATERYLTHEEYETLADEMPTTLDQLIMRLLTNTGLRYGEMAGLHRRRLGDGYLTVAEVWDESDGTIKAYPKGRRTRVVPVPPWLMELLEAQPARPCLANHADGKKCKGSLVLTTEAGHVLRHSNWSDVWRDAVERADIGDVRIHDLRHTYASWLIQSGVPLARVGQLMGHVSPATTMKYAHLGEVQTDDIMAALPAPLVAAPDGAVDSAPDLPHEGLDKA